MTSRQFLDKSSTLNFPKEKKEKKKKSVNSPAGPTWENYGLVPSIQQHLRHLHTLLEAAVIQRCFLTISA